MVEEKELTVYRYGDEQGETKTLEEIHRKIYGGKR